MTNSNKDSQAPPWRWKTQVEVDQLSMRIKDVKDCGPIQANCLNYNSSLPKVLQTVAAIGCCGFKLLYNTPLSTTGHQEIQILFLSLYGQPSMQQVAHEKSSSSIIVAHNYIIIDEH